MTASRTSPSRSQRMMGMTWRTLSSTRTEKAGSSSWVSLSWSSPERFCWTQAALSLPSHDFLLFHCCALLCFPKRRIKTITSNVFGAFRDLLSFCMASSVISRALKAFKSSSVSLCFCLLWSLFPSLLAPALLDLWFLCWCWCCPPFRRYVQPLLPHIS